MQGYFRNWVEINLNYLEENVKVIQKLLPSKTKIMAVVKDNAYGHGDIKVAQELSRIGVKFFAVSNISEGVRLRENSIVDPILILGYTPPAQFHLLHKYNLTQTLVSYNYTEQLNEYCNKHNFKISCHLKIDTGMGRIGFVYDGTSKTLRYIIAAYKFKDINIIGTYTHFSTADSLKIEDIAYTLQQNSLFQDVITKLREIGINPGALHTQNSAAILNYSKLSYDYVRPGMLLLGIPSGDITEKKKNIGLKPILQLKAKITMVKETGKGSYIGYGRNYITNKKTRIASVSIGYGDGYPRILSNQQTKVIVKGRFAEVIGNICMDQMMIDVTNIPKVQEGDVITLIGTEGSAGITIDQLSLMANTINNELAVNINSRVERIYYRSRGVSLQQYGKHSKVAPLLKLEAGLQKLRKAYIG